MNSIAAIIVTYNRRALLNENIHALENQTAKNLDLLIIDNASTDGTEEMVKELAETFPNISYFNTGANLGGAGGFQYGIKKAVELKYDYLWIMDDDCIPTETALQELLNAADFLDNNFGFLSSQVLWKDNSICKMNIPRETVFKNLTDFSENLKKVEMASFVSLFVKRETIEELGLPIKEFFVWTDDWEFTRRISMKYPSYWVKKSIVIHKSASNIGANVYSDSYERLNRYNYLYRNDVYLYRREGIRGFGYEAVRLLYHTFKVVTTAKDHKKERIEKIFKGTVNGLKFKPEIEYPENKNV